jgi:phage terminase small subunit
VAAPELHRLGLLTVVDVVSFAAYCYAYGQWRLAAEALARMAYRDETMHGLLIRTTDGNARRRKIIAVYCRRGVRRTGRGGGLLRSRRNAGNQKKRRCGECLVRWAS